jgi:hypothetical protein
MSNKVKLTRRSFLTGAGAATVAGAAALVMQPAPPAPRTVKTRKATVPPGQGYQLSEHVRSYYRTTSV